MYRNAKHETRLQHDQAGFVTVRRIHCLVLNALLVCICATASSTALAQSGDNLVAATNDGTVLSVTIPIFDPGIPSDPSAYRDMQVFPRIREIEAKLLPFLIRETLVETNQWGAVRVVTDPDESAELQLFGTIVRSDGDWLDLRIRSVDAAGYTWLDKVFSGQASAETDKARDDKDTPEFQAIFTEIADELAVLRKQIGDSAVANIKNTSLMLYASELAPSAFEGYLGENEDGTLKLLRLPARGDPMLRRIETIRNTEYVITDTVDTKFREFYADLDYTYGVWREYRRKFVEYKAHDVQFAQSGIGQYPNGSWESVKHQYDAYKFHRFTAQEQDRLAVAFNTEVTSTVERMEDRVEELEGWVDRGYLEWRGLLEELYELETQSSQ
jgi:hypothetical protein